MRKLLFLLPLLLFSISCQSHDDLQRRLISTNGYGEIKVKPDIAIINLSVRATHKSGKAAKEDVDNRVNNFLDTLKEMKIKEKDIIASTLRINPRYEHRSGTGRYFVGYEASRTMIVTLKNMKSLTQVMDRALEQRVEGIDNIRYDSSDAEKHQMAAHKLAIKDSKTKANALAEAYETELGPVVRIDYQNRNTLYGGETADAAAAPMKMRASAARPGRYLPDELSYSDTIQVVFDLIVSE